MIAIRDFTRSSSFRVGALLTTLAGLAIVLIIYFWRLNSTDLYVAESYAAVNAKTQALAGVYHSAGIETVIDIINSERLTADDTAQNKSAQSSPLRAFIVLSIKDEVIAGNLTEVPQIKEHHNEGQFKTFSLSITLSQQNESEVLEQALLEVVELGQYTLYVGRGIGSLYSAQWFAKTFSWIIVVLLCLLSILSFVVAAYVVNRINRMSQTADKIIKTGNLEERLEIDSNWDDLSSLSFVFNHMLDTIEDSVNNIKSVTDSIAHDLRTPLSRLRNTLEKIDDPKLREETTQEADNLLNMFNSLLRISGIETTKQKEGFTQCELNAIALDVIELYQPLAEERHIQLSSELAPIVMQADPNLLFQAIANILDNAIKYSNDGGCVEMELSETTTHITIAVRDNGIGVSEEDIVNLDRRFYRADRSRTSKGNGLGLSLVSAIITLHNGQLWFVHDPLMQGHGLGVVCSLRK